MRKILSSHLFLRTRLHPGLLDTLARSGASGLELFAARRHFDYGSLHAPLYADEGDDREGHRGGEPSVNVVHAEKSRRIDAMDEVKRALEAAEQIPFKHMVLHLGDRGDSWNPRTLENALTAVEHLQTYARPLGVRLLLENIQNEVTAPAHLLEILNVGHFDDVGICLDLGHAHLGDGVPAALRTLSDRVRTAHIHDNHGERDEHLWPGGGAIDFDFALKGLKTAKQSPAGVLEIHHSLGADPIKAVEKAKSTFDLFDKEYA